MEGKEVWITGAGLLTPLGENAAATWEGMRAGRIAVHRHAQADGPPRPEHCRYYGEVEGFEEPPEVPARLMSQRKFLNRGSILGLHAAREALKSAGLDLAAHAPERRALYVASGDFTRLGHLDFYAAVRKTAGPGWGAPDPKELNEAALHQVSPFFLLEGLANNLFSYLSALYEIMGPNGSVSSLSSCGAQALEHCDRALRWGEAEVGLAVGCGSWISSIILIELDGLGILSRASEGTASFRPFDRRRDGFFPGEGGAALVLETAEAARSRGARPLGRLLGTGNFHQLSAERYMPVPEEAVGAACRAALAEGGCALGELAFVLPHGSATKKGDRGELAALTALAREGGGCPPLAGWKPYTGHLGSASDMGEVILGLRALEAGVLPPTPGFERTEPPFAGLDIPAEERPVGGRAFLSLSTGLGGQSSALLVGAP